MIRQGLLLVLCLFVCLSVRTLGQIRLPKLVSNGAILQRDKPVKIWGWASPGERVELSFNNRKYNGQADGSGNWKIILPAQKAGGPYTMTLTGSNTITLENILFGDVWLCSGQSNMELTMDRVKDVYPKQIASSENSSIRQFLVPDQYDFKTANADLSAGEWKLATPQNLLSFSAVGYFFAVEINRKYNVPVGLINAALGGSPVEAWMSEDALKDFPKEYAEYKKFQDDELIKKIESEDQHNARRWHAELNAKDEGMNSMPRWTADEFDDSAWAEMELPGFWADRGFRSTNGAVWFRKQITIPSSIAGQQARLWLGRIVDQDSVFVNGKFVGTTGYQYPPRKYVIPAGLLREGKNTIAIRVINSAGNGGFVMDKPYFLAAGKDTVDLKGTWKYRLGAEMPPMPTPTFVRWKPVGLYNKMIAPLLNYAITGVIWYQGESNADRYQNYNALFSSMIRDWRSRWNIGDFPFLFVQLAGFMEPRKETGESDWAALREQQRKTLSLPNTGMVVATDLGEWNDIHPLNKADVGKRLSFLARKIAYGETKLVASGPMPVSTKFAKGSVTITFQDIGSGLVIRNGSSLQGFSLSFDGKKYHWASASIRGNNIVVAMPGTKSVPVSVRYAWADNPLNANLYNEEGLPATPFQLDRPE